jgi:hypothetical protein
MVMCSDERKEENPERLSAMQIESPCFKKAPPVAKKPLCIIQNGTKICFSGHPAHGLSPATVENSRLAPPANKRYLLMLCLVYTADEYRQSTFAEKPFPVIFRCCVVVLKN